MSKLQWLLHRVPIFRSFIAVTLHFVPHFIVANASSGNKSYRKNARPELLRVAAFATANATQHQRQRFSVSFLHVRPRGKKVSSRRAGCSNRQLHPAANTGKNALQLSHRSWISPRLGIWPVS